MKKFNELTYMDLLNILNKREKCVIIVDQITTKTAGFKKNVSFIAPIITHVTESEIKFSDMIINSNDKDSVWNLFIIKASKIASVEYININDVDCQVEIDFYV